MQKEFTFLITTKNRLEELKVTLDSLQFYFSQAELILCDDGSTDGTFGYVKNKYSEVEIIRNSKSKGLIYSRNLLLNMVRTKFAISLDDDANFLSSTPLPIIQEHFKNNPQCGLISFRIFWGNLEPVNKWSRDKVEEVKSFVGCGHAWRMAAWKSIPNYPDWFIFYGEEEYSSYHLFKKGWKIHYVPEVLIHHRVNNALRRKNKDFIQRTRRSLRSGLYLYLIFLPWHIIPGKIIYSLWMQVKLKVFKGDVKSSIGIIQAIGDFMFNLPRLIINRQPLSASEYKNYLKLSETKFYWKPEN